MSGLSLRTVQRLEAGHRVSYASLRALATAFGIDVDQLEQEFYAVKKSTDEFIEIPRWVRILSDRFWLGGPHISRRDALLIEIFCVACAVVALAVSFSLPEPGWTSVSRMSAIVVLGCCYLMALGIRIWDRYKLWPGSENAPPETPRTWRSVAAEYAFFITVGALGIALAAWLIS